MLLIVFLWIYIYFVTVLGLKEVYIQTPSAVKKGEDIRLHCLYDTEGDPLYIVKWYKSGREFYRYVPQENPASKSFPFGSLKIKESESNATQVTLSDVNTEMAGSYSCEVSADAPSFQTAIVTGTVDVVVLPPERPMISGLRNRYRPNDTLKLNCSSVNSRPAANLTWFINNKPVSKAFIKVLQQQNFSKELINTSILQFPLSSVSFLNGKLKIRCSAAIYDIYWQSTEVSAEEEKLRNIDLEPHNNVYGINYHQPPPNYQLGQKKLDGEIDIRVIGTSCVGCIVDVLAIHKLLIAFMVMIIQIGA